MALEEPFSFKENALARGECYLREKTKRAV